MSRVVEADTEVDAGSGKRSYSVPAAEKTLDIIEFLAVQPDGMTVTEIAGALGRSVHELPESSRSTGCSANRAREGRDFELMDMFR